MIYYVLLDVKSLFRLRQTEKISRMLSRSYAMSIPLGKYETCYQYSLGNRSLVEQESIKNKTALSMLIDNTLKQCLHPYLPDPYPEHRSAR